MDRIRVGVLTVSDGVARGLREDRSGAAIAAWLEARGHVLAERAVVADDASAIAAILAAWADSGGVDAVLTTGGTGLTPRDVTPEATLAVLEREAPGVAEAMRAAGAARTPFAWLSRGVVGVRSGVVIVNLPGSLGGVEDGLQVLAALLPHAVQLARGHDTERHAGPNA